MPTPMLVEIDWDIHTADEWQAGTDGRITCEILRDDALVFTVILEPGKTTRLDRGRGDVLTYAFERPYLVSPVNLALSQGTVGVEYPNGFVGHLKMRLRNSGPDRWIKDTINVYGRVGELYRDEEGGSLLVFEDGGRDWIDLGSFTKRKVLSTDPAEGSATLTLIF
jgi:hypothetical protein